MADGHCPPKAPKRRGVSIIWCWLAQLDAVMPQLEVARFGEPEAEAEATGSEVNMAKKWKKMDENGPRVAGLSV